MSPEKKTHAIPNTCPAGSPSPRRRGVALKRFNDESADLEMHGLTRVDEALSIDAGFRDAYEKAADPEEQSRIGSEWIEATWRVWVRGARPPASGPRDLVDERIARALINRADYARYEAATENWKAWPKDVRRHKRDEVLVHFLPIEDETPEEQQARCDRAWLLDWISGLDAATGKRNCPNLGDIGSCRRNALRAFRRAFGRPLGRLSRRQLDWGNAYLRRRSKRLWGEAMEFEKQVAPLREKDSRGRAQLVAKRRYEAAGKRKRQDPSVTSTESESASDQSRAKDKANQQTLSSSPLDQAVHGL